MRFVEVKFWNCLLRSIIPQLRSVVYNIPELHRIAYRQSLSKAMQFSHRRVGLLLPIWYTYILKPLIGLEPRQKFCQNMLHKTRKLYIPLQWEQGEYHGIVVSNSTSYSRDSNSNFDPKTKYPMWDICCFSQSVWQMLVQWLKAGHNGFLSHHSKLVLLFSVVVYK